MRLYTDEWPCATKRRMQRPQPLTLRKRTRLPAENYWGQRTFFVTVCCERRQAFLLDRARALRVVELLPQVAAQFRFSVHAYCVMPDHLHLLAEGTAPNSNLVNFIRVLKLRSGFAEKQQSGSRLWQRSFYDHILRPKDNADRIAWYIWMNPVRKGLCVEPEDYPFSGSLTLEWKRKPRPIESWLPPWK